MIKIRVLQIFSILLTLICLGRTECNLSSESEKDHQKLFSFGIMADIQYADKATNGKRFYRESCNNLKSSVLTLNGQNLDFVIQLGDIIDGNNSLVQTQVDMKKILTIFNQLDNPLYHVVGNHCLTAGEEFIKEQLRLKQFYYDFVLPVSKEWRFIVLNGNDAGYGILGMKQLEWLKSKLEFSRKNGEKVIIFNHYALYKAAAEKHRMKIAEPVADIINNSQCVVAYIAGHDHAGGYSLINGIHHLTLKGMVEAPKKNAFAVIEVFPEKLKVIGFGKELTRELMLPEFVLRK